MLTIYKRKLMIYECKFAHLLASHKKIGALFPHVNIKSC